MSKNRHPGILTCTFFTRKVSTVIVIEGSWAPYRLQNAKTSNIWQLVPATTTLAKTCSRMKTATTFFRQNYAASSACTTYYWENLVLLVVLVSESKALYFVKWQQQYRLSPGKERSTEKPWERGFVDSDILVEDGVKFHKFCEEEIAEFLKP